MTVHTFYATTGTSDRVYSNGSVYSTVREGDSLFVDGVGAVGQTLSGTYFCIEPFIAWDTSSIADEDTVSAVTLSLYGDTDNSTTDFTITAATKAWLADVTTADWVAGSGLSSLTTLATYDTSGGWSTTGYNDFTSNANFLTAIDKTGNTEIMLYSDRHSAGTTPTGDENVVYSTADVAGTTEDPKLVVTSAVDITPGVGSLALSGSAPSVFIQMFRQPGAGNLLLSSQAVVLDRTDARNAIPSAGDLLLGGDQEPDAVALDASSDYLSHGSDFTGLADSASWTFAAWIRRDGSTGGSQYVYTNATVAGFAVRLDFNGSGVISFTGTDGGGNFLHLDSSAAFTDGDWHHVMASSDGTNKHLYVDGTDDIAVQAFDSTVIDFTTGSHYVGARYDATLKMYGALFDLWFDPGTYIDLSSAANRALFYNTNTFVPLGASGELPTGSSPILFLSDKLASWHTNQGTGGGMTLNGSFGRALGPPGTHQPRVAVDNSPDPGQGSLLLSSANVTAARTDNHFRTPGQGSLLLSSAAITVSQTLNHRFTTTQGNLLFSGQAPSFLVSITIQAGQGDLVLSAENVTFAQTANHFRTPTTGDLLFSGGTPTFDINGTVIPGVGDLAFSTAAPSLLFDAHRIVTAGDLLFSAVAPVVGGSFKITLQQGNLVFSSAAIARVFDQNITITAGDLVLDTYTVTTTVLGQQVGDWRHKVDNTPVVSPWAAKSDQSTDGWTAKGDGASSGWAAKSDGGGSWTSKADQSTDGWSKI